jgi:hypothetical protein
MLSRKKRVLWAPVIGVLWFLALLALWLGQR